jgi:hypothetical protein
MVAAYQWSRPPGRRAYARARNARARNPPVAPNHRGECLRFDFQVYAHRGQGQTPNADRHTHRPAERPIETAEWCLKPGHRGTERLTCASQSIFTKRSSQRAHCRQPTQRCSPALRRSDKHGRSPNRSLAFTDHELGQLLQYGRSQSENNAERACSWTCPGWDQEGYRGSYRRAQTGELARQAVAADDDGRRAAARLCGPCRAIAVRKGESALDRAVVVSS